MMRITAIFSWDFAVLVETRGWLPFRETNIFKCPGNTKSGEERDGCGSGRTGHRKDVFEGRFVPAADGFESEGTSCVVMIIHVCEVLVTMVLFS